MYDLSNVARDFPWAIAHVEVPEESTPPDDGGERSVAMAPDARVAKEWAGLPAGWGDVARLHLDRLNVLVGRNDWAVDVIQVKEKLGTLRFQYRLVGGDGRRLSLDESHDTKRFRELVWELEAESARVCWRCGTGEDVRCYNDDWRHYSCPACERRAREEAAARDRRGIYDDMRGWVAELALGGGQSPDEWALGLVDDVAQELVGDEAELSFRVACAIARRMPQGEGFDEWRGLARELGAAIGVPEGAVDRAVVTQGYDPPLDRAVARVLGALDDPALRSLLRSRYGVDLGDPREAAPREGAACDAELDCRLREAAEREGVAREPGQSGGRSLSRGDFLVRELERAHRELARTYLRLSMCASLGELHRASDRLRRWVAHNVLHSHEWLRQQTELSYRTAVNMARVHPDPEGRDIWEWRARRLGRQAGLPGWTVDEDLAAPADGLDFDEVELLSRDWLPDPVAHACAVYLDVAGGHTG